MLRVVLAVVLASALLGATLPLVERARVGHSEAQVSSELDRLETAATDLADRNDPVPANRTGARRTLTLRLPENSWARAGVSRLTVGPASAPKPLRWQVDGGDVHHSRLADGLIVGPADGLELGSGGRKRVVLTLEQRGGEPSVVIRRPEAASSGGDTVRG